MGTKNNPGTWDCYENAEPDEPMFILLARDPHAPHLVRIWASLREGNHADAVLALSDAMGIDKRSDTSKTDEARCCAQLMRRWWWSRNNPEKLI